MTIGSNGGRRTLDEPARIHSASGDCVVAVVFTSALSLGLSCWYATSEFIPATWLRASSMQAGYDAYRYDDVAGLISRWPVHEIVFERVAGFSFAGYVRFLAVVYSLFTPNTVVGCIANWVLWCVAGLLLAPTTIRDHPGGRPIGAVFLGLWLLLPESIDWTGTTSKEPLCAAIVAAALHLGSMAVDAPVVRLALCGGGVALLAFVGQEVRGALLVLIVLPWSLALEARIRRRPAARVPWAFSGIVAIVLANFLDLGGDLFGAVTGHASGRIGYEFGTEAWCSTSSHSGLLQVGSTNKWIDTLAVPIRGFAHIVAPLNASPMSMPIAQVSSQSLLQWSSAAIYSVLAVAIALQFGSGRSTPRPRADVVLACTSLLAILVLGTTGIIHERYRSILVPAYLPLGVRCLWGEIEAHGLRRMAPTGVAAVMIATLAYIGLKSV